MRSKHMARSERAPTAFTQRIFTMALTKRIFAIALTEQIFTVALSERICTMAFTEESFHGLDKENLQSELD